MLDANFGSPMEVQEFDPPPTSPMNPQRVSIECLDGLRRYLHHGVKPGDFLTAVISNDLREAVGRADNNNMEIIPAYVYIMYNHFPRGSWGSPENMTAWINHIQAIKKT